MIFNTYWFFVFFAIFYSIFLSLRHPRLRYYWLLVSCVVFHTHFAGPAGVIPIAVIGTLTFLAAKSRKQLLIDATIVLCIGALCFYKYTLFLSQQVSDLLSSSLSESLTMHVQSHLPSTPPLAISFFSFEFVHYLMEVRRGQNPITKPTDFIVFSIFFPSLVAGPIKRYQQFLPELKSGLERCSLEHVANGIMRIALGAFKKIVLADNITLALNFYTPNAASLSIGESWLFVAALSLRILLDFSGYSDMAIGFAEMLGIALPENFNFPYFATSLQDFWQRWHISLSSWIRDYVYIPLGGSRNGPLRKLRNGIIAFALCGLWHGAAWNFIVWGMWHGVGLAINHSYPAILGRPGRWLQARLESWPLLGWTLTLSYVATGWLLFFLPVGQAWLIFTHLFFKR